MLLLITLLLFQNCLHGVDYFDTTKMGVLEAAMKGQKFVICALIINYKKV